MFDNRSLRGDISLVGLVALIIFLTVSLFTYDPADPTAPLAPPLDDYYQPSALVFPLNETPANACGTIGATTADLLFANLGFGAYYLLVGLVTLAVALVRTEHTLSPWIRTIGWALSLVGVTCLTSLTLSDLTPGPVTGSGGYLGLLGVGMLKSQFAFFGSILIATGVLIVGLLLWTDYLALRVGHWLLAGIFGAAAVGYKRRQEKRATRRERISDLDIESDDDDEYEEENHTIKIRVGGKTAVEDRVVDQDEDEEYEYDEDELDEDEYDEDDAEYYDEESDEDYEDFEDEPATLPVVVKTAAKKAISSLKAKPAAIEEPVDEEPVDEPPKKKGLLRGPHFKIRKPKPEPQPSERDKVMMKLDQAARVDDETDYELPAIDMLLQSDDVSFDDQRKDAMRNAQILERTFAEFGFKVKVTEIETGPVIAQYEISLEAGLRLSKITGLADDLAIALRVPSVRIVAPIPGKNTVGIEVPNNTRQIVRLRDVMEQSKEKTRRMKIPIFMGQDVVGDPLVCDLAALPHLLIAGRTGTGKSVCLNAIISSILMTRRPDEVRMLMIDPKMVELSGYGRLPHLMHPVVTDMRKAEAILEWAVNKMEERYKLLAKVGVRHVTSFNQLGADEIYRRLDIHTPEERLDIPTNLPFIVIIADEMADLMMTAGKEVEQHIIRLAQKSRAVGIHLILATQKPTVDVITGLIKSNLPARIAFQVASRTDSRVVLDAMGADKLLGNGDMLFLGPGTSTLMRGQGTYLSDDEIEKVTEACSTGEQNFVNELVNIKVSDKEGDASGPGAERKHDDLYHQAVETVISENRGSVSLLQRCLGIGYGRAARLIDFMEEDGVVGPYNGSKSREILMTMSQWEAFLAGGSTETESESSPVDIGYVKPQNAPQAVAPGKSAPKSIPTTTSTAQAALEEILAEADEDDEDEDLIEEPVAGSIAPATDDEADMEYEYVDEDDEEYEYVDDEAEEDEYEDEEAEDDKAEDDEEEYEYVDEDDQTVAELEDNDEHEEEDDKDVEYEYIEVEEGEEPEDDDEYEYEYEYVEVEEDEVE